MIVHNVEKRNTLIYAKFVNDSLLFQEQKSSCVSVNKANGRDRDYRVSTQTGKPGKMGKHFPVREKSGNFVSPEKWEPWIRYTGPPEAYSGRGAREHAPAPVK